LDFITLSTENAIHINCLRGPAVIDYTEPKLKFSAKHFPGAVKAMMCAATKKDLVAGVGG